MTATHDDLREIYSELRTVARALLRREPYAHTLESCELVNQAWARILHGDLRDAAETDPKSVLALAVTNMRRELVDHARDLGQVVPLGPTVTRREQSVAIVSGQAHALARRADSFVFGPSMPAEAAAATSSDSRSPTAPSSSDQQAIRWSTRA